MSVDLKTLTPDTTLPQDGVLFGADSQAAASPSVYPVSNVKTALNSGIATLASGNSILWDMGANPVATVTLTDNATLYVSNYNAGGTYKLVVFQNITGNWTLSYDPNIKWPNNTAPTVSTAANAMTVLEFVSDGTFIYGTVSQAYDGWAPTVSSLFARPAGDYSTLPSTSTMPTGGSISRAGNAMLYDSTGKLTYAPNNLYINSGSATNTARTITTQAGVNYYIWIQTSTGTATIVASGTNTSTFNGSTSGTYTAFTATAGTLTLTPTSNFANITQVVVAAITYETALRSVDNVVTSSSAYYGPRFDYDPRPSLTGTASIAGSAVTLPAIFNDGTPASSIDSAYVGQTITVGGTGYPVTAYVGSTRIATVTGTPTSGSQSFTLTNPGYLLNRGLLVEGQLQQLVSWSEDFRDTATAGSTRPWTNLNVTVSTGAAVGPAGSQTANSFFETAATSEHQVNDPAISFAANTPYTLSVYVKSIGGRNCSLFWYTNSINTVLNACFDLSAGTIITPATASGSAPPANVSAAITSVGSGWYRVSITGTTGATAGLGAIRIHAASGTSNSYAGDITKGIYAFGAQLEARAFPTSYLPTQGGTSPFATRAAETFSLTGYANRLVEAYYIDEQTGANYSGNSALSTGTVTISPPTFGWVTSLRAYQNAYAGSISSPSWLSFSRAGGAMYYDSTGTLTWAPENLLLNSATLSTQSVVVTSPTVTTAGQLGSNYILSFKGTGSVAITGTSLVFYTGSSTLAGTGASNRVSACFFAAQGTLTFTVTGTVTEAQLERVTYQTAPSAYIPTTSAAVYGPRYDFDPSTVPATPRGLLIEEQRSNLLTYSNMASVGWLQSSAVITNPGNILAPDGTNNAALYSPTAGVNNLVYQNATMPSTSTASFYVKSNGAAYFAVRLYDGTNPYFTWFNITNGTIGTNQNASAAIVNVGNGWYRCSVTKTFNAAAGNVLIGVGDADNSLQVASASSKAYVWGAQLEAGSFATSYIPTTTDSVTRAADIAQLTGSALTTLQGSAFSTLAECVQLSNVNNPVIAARNNAGAYINVAWIGSKNIYVNSGNTSQFTPTYSPAPTVTSVFRVGMAATANNFAAVANNGTVQPSSSGAMPVGINFAYLGYYVDGFWLNGVVRSLALYNQRLPDTILKQKSTVGAPY